LSADPYSLLGVSKDASQEDIQKAYRKLAKKLHPDLNPGNKTAEENFKQVSAAYDLLGDPEKRARFDRGEIDESGAERPRQRYYRDFADDMAGTHAYSSDAGFADFEGEDILSEIFGRSAGARATRPRRGFDIRYTLPVDFLDAVNGATRQVRLADGSELKVTIPPGTRDGQVLRLRGKGEPGRNEGPAGDALVEITVQPHPAFERKGDDIHVELPLSLREAVLGGKVPVPTTTGTVTLTVPPWSNSGKMLRLRGKGVVRPDGTRGDQYATVKIVLPDGPDPELESFMAGWRQGQRQDPRRKAEA